MKTNKPIRMQQKISLLFTFLLFISLNVMAQDQNKIDIGLRHIEENAKQWNLVSDDYKDIMVSDMYTSAHNGVTHLFFNQTYKGIPIHNAIAALAIDKNGKVGYSTCNFIIDIENKVQNATMDISAMDAIVMAAKELGVTKPDTPTLLRSSSDSEMVFAATNFTNREIPVKVKYQLNNEDQLILCWDFSLDMKSNADYWSIRTDAKSGTIVNKDNWTVYCKHDKGGFTNHSNNCSAHQISDHQSSYKNANVASTMIANSSYNVFALPAESPIHGPQLLLEDPAIIESSPFGWHDVDGMEGADFTITRGNNVWAYLDTDDNNFTDGVEPDGGDSLYFDFPYDISLEPDVQSDLAQVNLFYMSNMVHDIMYTLGFDEASGNFQQNNYGNGGLGNDNVLAEAQDGGGTNNANFATPPDGSSGRMQMFLWNNTAGVFKITSPSPLAGFYEAGTADFGAQIVAENIDVEAEAKVVEDALATNGGSFTDGCSELVNDLRGKVAIVDRGNCDFSHKVFYAQQAGAVAVVICNIPGASSPGDDGNSVINMTGQDFITEITVPSIFSFKSTCDAIKSSINAGIPVTIHIKNHEIVGADQLDGDLDNGIIAHEYGHGISTRLTGGPSAGCLSGEEQMGEGWSDFFALITTVEAGDTGADVRGIGNFATASNVDGLGIRNYPYSTDMSINPQTYDDIKTTNIPHGVGEIWSAMLWDMYWAFVDEYGWSADWNDKTSGNYMASLLVIDGMKLQGCAPGFIQGRNAILAADEFSYGGAHQCLIWEVFARRGLGFFAEGGSSDSATDGNENFDPRPTCIEDLKITKSMDQLIAPNEESDVTLVVTNHVPQITTGVVVTDEIPSGLSYIDGSASMPATLTGDILSFELGDMAFEDEITITYKVLADNSRSETLLIEDMEDLSESFFNIEVLELAPNIWSPTNSDAYSGEISWYVPSLETESDQALNSDPFEVTGTRPTLRFFHRYNCEATADAGFVQISTDDGSTWDNLSDEFILNGYNNGIQYGTLAIPNLNGFSGLQEDWIDSYADLSAFIGQTIRIRFRFATDDNTTVEGDLPGWLVDDFELLDLLTYESRACVTATNVSNDERCTDVQTVFVNSSGTSSIIETEKGPFEVNVYPNPASDLLNIQITSSFDESGVVGLYTIDGKMMKQSNIDITNATKIITINTSEIPSGFYFIRIQTNIGSITEKIMIK